tara:strand:- start:3072 stop:3407 length:336 start_codon:yes stop_codon:yes gene_type:complete
MTPASEYNKVRELIKKFKVTEDGAVTAIFENWYHNVDINYIILPKKQIGKFIPYDLPLYVRMYDTQPYYLKTSSYDTYEHYVRDDETMLFFGRNKEEIIKEIKHLKFDLLT